MIPEVNLVVGNQLTTQTVKLLPPILGWILDTKSRTQGRLLLKCINADVLPHATVSVMFFDPLAESLQQTDTFHFVENAA